VCGLSVGLVVKERVQTLPISSVFVLAFALSGSEACSGISTLKAQA